MRHITAIFTQELSFKKNIEMAKVKEENEEEEEGLKNMLRTYPSVTLTKTLYFPLFLKVRR